eukprot:10046750-Heterocapsa_arctica.AAC.1
MAFCKEFNGDVLFVCLRRLVHGSRLSKVSGGRGTRRLIIGGWKELAALSMVITRVSGFEDATVKFE